MEIKSLRYFIVIAQEENITRAAEKLHVSQPTLSRQLQEIEEDLGVRLYTRSNFSIKLTEEGQHFKKRAQEILSLVDKTENEFREPNEIGSNDIYIGCAETESMSLVIDAFDQVRGTYPNARLHLYSSASDSIDYRLSKGIIDLALIVNHIDLDKYNYLTLPPHDRWGLYVLRSNPLSSMHSISKNRLLTLPLIVSRQSLNDELPRLLGKDVENIHLIATYDLIYNATLMVEKNMGFLLGFDHLIKCTRYSNFRFIPLQPEVYPPIYIIWKKQADLSPACKLLLEELEKIS